jgi:hypothetical protein
MRESFLHFVWQYQYFDKNDLCTTEGSPIDIYDQGFLQHDSGPDFSQCRIKIDELEWSGNVEIHVNASAWMQHRHHEDKAYDNVVLHVIWNNDQEMSRTDGTRIPVLELKNRVDPTLIMRYENLINQLTPIPCEQQYGAVSSLTVLSMWDKALMNRLERKADQVTVLYRQLANDWEDTAYKLLGQNFGFKVNGEAFLQLVKAVPLKYIHKHANNLLQVEALLFGQAGFLDETEGDAYYSKLRKEYLFLNEKYQLAALKLVPHQWKFMRLRPANFPTIRIAELATILVNLKHVFSLLLNTQNFKALYQVFSQPTSEYWTTHYQFGKQSQSQIKMMGRSSMDNVIINTVVPLLVAYGRNHQEEQYVARAVSFLQKLKPENNRITRLWNKLDQRIKSAFDSQAGIELHNEYCMERRCLNCNIGVHLLTNS